MAFRDALMVGSLAAASWMFWGRAFYAKLAPALEAMPINRVFLILFQQRDKYFVELLLIGLVLIFLINMVIGKRKNERMAVNWTNVLAEEGGILDRNFALVGLSPDSGRDILLKESSSTYKLHATGRRYCQGALCTFKLRPRQDLLSMIHHSLWSNLKDTLEIQVAMNEGSVPPLVLFIGTIAVAKSKQDEHLDLGTFAKKVEVARDRLAAWPSDRLTVLAEQPSVFYDFMNAQVMELAFGPQAFEIIKPYFKYLHISSEFEEAGVKQTIRLGFNLPVLRNGAVGSEDQVAVVNKMLTLVCLLIDMVGSYKLSPEQAKRAAELRQKKGGAGKKDVVEERERKAEERRLAKEAEEKARLARMTPAQREKERERKERIARERRIRSMAKYK